MNNFLAKNSAGLLLLLLPFLGQSQTAPRILTLEEVVQLGMANSKQLQISIAKADVAHSRINQAKVSTIPSLTYTGSYYRLSDNVTPFETPLFTIPILVNQTLSRVSLSQPVFTGLRALNTIRATEFLENAARFDLEKDKKDVQLNLLTASINLYKLQEAGKVFQSSLATAQNRLTDTRNLNQQGLALDNDVLKADLVVTQLETARLETNNAIAAGQYGLNVLLGLPTGTPVQIDPAGIAEIVTPETLEAFLTNATQRMDYRAATQRALASEKLLKVGKGVYFPLVSVGANLYTNNPNQRQFPIVDRFITTWDVGVQISWNMSGLYTSKYSVQEATLNLVQANTQRDQISDAAQTDIANNFYAWQTAVQKISLSEKSLLQSTENQRITNLRSGQQIASVTDLLDADVLLLQSKINQVTAIADARLAYFRLLKSAGRL